MEMREISTKALDAQQRTRALNQTDSPVGSVKNGHETSGLSRVALIHDALNKTKQSRGELLKIFKGNSICAIGLDPVATKDYTNTIDRTLSKILEKTVLLTTKIISVAQRVVYDKEGKASFNDKPKILMHLRANSGLPLAANEVSVDMARGITPRIALFEARRIGISCNTVGLHEYQTTTEVLIRMCSEVMRKAAEAFINTHNVTAEDLRLLEDQDEFKNFENSDADIEKRWFEVFDQKESPLPRLKKFFLDVMDRNQPSRFKRLVGKVVSALVGKNSKLGTHDESTILQRNFVRLLPDGSIDTTDAVGLDLLQRILLNIPVGGFGMGKDYAMVDNITAVIQTLPDLMKEHPDRGLPVILGTKLTMGAVLANKFGPWAQATPEYHNLIDQLAPLSQEIIWRFKRSENQKVPDELDSWYPGENLRDVDKCHERFADLLKILHQSDTKWVVLACTELPPLMKRFKDPKLGLCQKYGITWDLPEVIDPAEATTHTLMQFVEEKKLPIQPAV